MPDRQAILKALDVLYDSDQIVEVRAFRKGRKQTDAGYYDSEHREQLADEVGKLNAAGAAVYLTLNRIDPQLIGRYHNRIQAYAEATATDANVIERRWLLLDFDPVRPKDTSATPDQLQAAHEKSRECYRFLKAAGWPDPVAAASGNGYHLLYPLALPADIESRDLVKGALEGLARRFDDDAVKVDQSVFNAARITKCYGTVANKGDHTEVSPHRLSKLISTPARGPCVTREQLKTLHVHVEPIASRASTSFAAFDLVGFLARLGIAYTQDMHEGSERFKLDHCPFNTDHGKGEAAVFRAGAGQLGFKCQHNSCSDKTWHDVRALVDGPRETRQRVEVSRQHSAIVTGRASASESESHIAYRRVADIQAKPIRWLWQGRIARGKVSMLAGNPGLGKSQVTASMASIVTTGGAWPVDRTRCERGAVVFLSAEDDAEDTIRPRLEAAGADLARVFILDAVVEAYRADGGEIRRAFNLKTDLARLSAMLDEIGDVALVVVDPITAYLGDADSHKNAEIRALLSPLSDLAAKHEAAVVCVSHLNKGGNNDALMRVTGSLAFVAAARSAWLVARDQEDANRRLFLPLKNNNGNDQTGLAFAVQSAQVRSDAGLIETSHVVWEAEAVTVTADEAMSPQSDPEERSAVDDAKDFLQGLLADGAIAAKRVYGEGRQAGYSERTLRRAQKALGVEAVKDGLKAGWSWRLPPKAAKFPEDVHTKGVDAFGDVGHLRQLSTGAPHVVEIEI